MSTRNTLHPVTDPRKPSSNRQRNFEPMTLIWEPPPKRQFRCGSYPHPNPNATMVARMGEHPPSPGSNVPNRQLIGCKGQKDLMGQNNLFPNINISLLFKKISIASFLKYQKRVGCEWNEAQRVQQAQWYMWQSGGYTIICLNGGIEASEASLPNNWGSPRTKGNKRDNERERETTQLHKKGLCIANRLLFKNLPKMEYRLRNRH